MFDSCENINTYISQWKMRSIINRPTGSTTSTKSGQANGQTSTTSGEYYEWTKSTTSDQTSTTSGRRVPRVARQVIP